jgi:hypothetical protein
MILAVPASLSPHDLSIFESAGVEVWDLRFLVDRFAKQIRDAPAGYYKGLILSLRARLPTITRAEQLRDGMRACRAGKEDWRLYQAIVGEMLEFLLTPPLDKPIFQLSDRAQANRRDFILPNYAETEFWAFMRNRYRADYIVVDAKNSAKKVGKSDVLQLANYLKAHGAGLFGMIICRCGGNAAGCEHTLREEWQNHQRLIVILSDADIEKMLVAKSEGRSPDDLIRERIEQFRLSM